MSERLICAIPGCKRTRHNREGFSDWICGKHWTMAPKKMRATYSKARQDYREQFGNNGYWNYKAGSDMRLAAVSAHNAVWEAWQGCLDDVTGRCVAGGDL